MFKQFDPNGNGYLSLAEVDKGILDILKIESLFQCKPAVIRAFTYAKDFSNSKNEDGPGEDFIEMSEFRVFLLALRQYFEYFEAFRRIDENMDRKINIEEFKKA